MKGFIGDHSVLVLDARRKIGFSGLVSSPGRVMFPSCILWTSHPGGHSLVLEALRPDGHLVVKGFNRFPRRDSGPVGLTQEKVVQVIGTEQEGLLLQSLNGGRNGSLRRLQNTTPHSHVDDRDP